MSLKESLPESLVPGLWESLVGSNARSGVLSPDRCGALRGAASSGRSSEVSPRTSPFGNYAGRCLMSLPGSFPSSFAGRSSFLLKRAVLVAGARFGRYNRHSIGIR